MDGGSLYSGDFEENLFHGEGTLQKKSGEKLAGEWRRGKIAGRGRIEFANGDIYEGGSQRRNRTYF